MRSILLTCLLVSPLVQAGGVTKIQTRYSHDVSYTLPTDGLPVRPNDVLRDDGSGSGSLRVDLGPLPEHVNVAAVHMESSEFILFAVDTAVLLPGMPAVVRPHDVVRWSGSSYSLRFQGTGAQNADLDRAAIDAITEDDQGRLALSFDIDVPLTPGPAVMRAAGLHALADDFTLFDTTPVFDPVIAGIPAGTDLEAAHLSTAQPFPGLFLLSFDTAIEANSLPVAAHQVVLASGNSLLGQALVPGIVDRGDDNAVRLDALWYGEVEIVNPGEIIFRDHFETGGLPN